MKNTFQINKYSCFLLLGITIAAAQIVLANDGLFQNNLLKMDVSKTSPGGVKVTLFTTKPYKDSVVVNKKSDREYVILMPETASSMTAKPSVKGASDVVQNIEVKTQQYSPEQGQKGYTKIIFSTVKPIEIVPQTQTARSDYQLSDKEYKELMSQTAKKKTLASKPANQQVTKPAVKPTAPPRPEKIVLRSYNEPAKKVVKKAEKKEVAQKSLIKPVTRPIVSAKSKLTEQNVIKPSPVKPQKTQMTQPTAPQPQKVEPVQEEKISTQPTPLPVVNEAEKVVPQPQAVPVETSQKHLRKYQKLINKVKGNYALGLGIILIPILIFILLYRAARRTIKNMQQQRSAFITNMEEKPSSPVDYSEKISDKMDWKEKFQTYVDTKNQVEPEEAPPVFEAESATGEHPDLVELFGLEEGTQEIEDISEEPSSLDEFIQAPYTEETELSADELFGEEEEEFTEDYFDIEEPEEEQMILSSFKLDSERGFYLVDYEGATSLVGYIGDDIYVLKKFDRPIKNPIQARLNERNATADNYLIKIDGFKAVVEVTSYGMKLLIEL